MYYIQNGSDFVALIYLLNVEMMPLKLEGLQAMFWKRYSWLIGFQPTLISINFLELRKR